MYSLDVNFLSDRGLNTAVDTDLKAPKKPIPLAEQIPLIVGGILLVLFPLLSWNYAKGFKAKQAEAESQIKQVEGEIARIQGENKSIEEMEAQVKKAKADTQALVGVFDKIRPWSAILQEVSDRTPPGVQVSSLSQSGSNSNLKLQISGSARSYNDVNDFILFLQRSPFFDKKGIILGNVKQGDLNIEIANEDDLPDRVSVIVPEGVQYNLTAQLKNVPTSRLIEELKNKGSVGLVTRLKTLEEKGAIDK